MAEMTPELQAAIDVAKQRVKVEPYFTKVMKTGVQGHAQGFWSGTFMGLLSGGMAGGLCSLAMTIGAVASPLIGLPLVLGAAGVGAAMGGFTGSRVGSSAGTVSGAFAERERRDRAAALEQEILRSPEKQREVIEAYRANPVVEKTDTVEQAFATSQTPAKAWAKVIDWKTMLLAVVLCATVGAIVCAGAFSFAGGAAVVAATGKAIAIGGWGALSASTVGGAAVIGAGLGAASGVTFGINFPMVFANLTQKASDLLSGKMVRGQSQFERTKTVPEVQQEAQYNQRVTESIQEARPVARQIPLAQIQRPIAADRLQEAEQNLAI